jgi:hypothetical protein
MNGSDPRTVITDIDIPFGRLVVFFVKAGLASIPAFIVIWLIMAVVMMAFGALFGLPIHWRAGGMMS